MPVGLPFNSNQYCYEDGLPSNVTKATPAYHGSYAIQLQTITNHLAYALNTDPKGGDLNSWTNGIAYTDSPAGIRGYYKYNVENADTALLVVMFRKNSTTIGNYIYKLGGIKSNFTLFDFNFIPALTQVPDSLIFSLTASDYFKNPNGLNGSTLIVDSVSLKGVSSQPALLDGDFETWQNQPMPLKLDEWNPQHNQEGISRSADAKNGLYAVELKTYLGEENNTPVARPGYLTSGYWDDNCGCMQGGLPYTSTKDTLAFWYKYSPQSNDQAQVYLDFQKNNSSIGIFFLNLNAASTYQYAELPFQLGDVPDHVIVQAISSLWQNTDQNYVGSTLLLDSMYFKTSNLSTQNQLINTGAISFWPNPVTDKLNISNLGNDVQTLDIYSITGKKMLSISHPTNVVDISILPTGIYFIKMDNVELLKSYKIVKL